MGKKSFLIKEKAVSQSFRDLVKNDFGLEQKAVWLGVTIALGCWFFCAVGLLLWIVVSGAGTYRFSMLLYFLGILGVLLGGIVAGKKAVNRGWLHGLWVGIILGILGIIVNLELIPELYSWAAIGRQLLVWSLWGFTGGYIGTHFKGMGREKDIYIKESDTMDTHDWERVYKNSSN